MKKYNRILAIGSVIAGLSVAFVSCDKSISEPQRVGYTPTSIDEKAGSWKTYVLTAPTDVTLATPSSTSSTAYQAELTDLKSKSASLTQEQQEAVVYWGTGAVYRWNEIARELCAVTTYLQPQTLTVNIRYQMLLTHWPIPSSVCQSALCVPCACLSECSPIRRAGCSLELQIQV